MLFSRCVAPSPMRCSLSRASPVRHAGSSRRPKFCHMLQLVARWSRICPIGALECRRHGGGDRPMFRTPQARLPARPCGGRRGILAAGLAVLLSACSGTLSSSDMFGTSSVAPAGAEQAAQSAIGTGQTKVGLLLPLSAPGNAGLAGQAMRNAAELAFAEFNNANIQLLVKDDGGTAQGAQQAAQQAIDEGAEIILGPLFAFSTDSNVAGRGIFLLSFLPESDVDRIVAYAIAQGRRSFVGFVPDSPYGSVVEAEFKQVVARKGGRVVAVERYAADGSKMTEPARLVAEAAARADVLFIPD